MPCSGFDKKSPFNKISWVFKELLADKTSIYKGVFSIFWIKLIENSLILSVGVLLILKSSSPDCKPEFSIMLLGSILPITGLMPLTPITKIAV